MATAPNDPRRLALPSAAAQIQGDLSLQPTVSVEVEIDVDPSVQTMASVDVHLDPERTVSTRSRGRANRGEGPSRGSLLPDLGARGQSISVRVEEDDAPPPEAPPREGGDFTRFEDEGEVARGGMSSIRQVIDLRLGRRQAMKVIDPSAEPGSNEVERFVYEAHVTGQLDHPNIVPIYDLGLDKNGEPAFMTMKLVAGESLAAFLDHAGEERLSTAVLGRAVQVLLKVCDALSFAHGRGIIHCDIKPANIMIGSHGQVYMMDWGLALATPHHAVRPVSGWQPPPLRRGMVTGTPAYMAPEQALGRVDELDERTDVYGIGATLYRILTGRPPHLEETVMLTIQKAQRGYVTPPEKAVSDVRLPPELCRIAMKALAPDADRRYPTMDAFREDLERFQHGGGWLPTATYAAGELIVRQGDPADAAYIVVEGVVEAFKTVDGRRMPLREMGPGEVFGEAAVFTSHPRTASVVAKTDVTVKVVTGGALERELSENPWIGALVKALAERFRDIDERLTQLTRPEPGG